MGVSQCQKNGKKSKREKEKVLDEIAQAKKKKALQGILLCQRKRSSWQDA